jgi:hypothetical protein
MRSTVLLFAVSPASRGGAHFTLRRPVWTNLSVEVPLGKPRFPLSKNQPATGSLTPSDQDTTRRPLSVLFRLCHAVGPWIVPMVPSQGWGRYGGGPP